MAATHHPDYVVGPPQEAGVAQGQRPLGGGYHEAKCDQVIWPDRGILGDSWIKSSDLSFKWLHLFCVGWVHLLNWGARNMGAGY